jgi:hypothetical protein
MASGSSPSLWNKLSGISRAAPADAATHQHARDHTVTRHPDVSLDKLTTKVYKVPVEMLPAEVDHSAIVVRVRVSYCES